MKRFMLACPILLLLISASAFADSVKIILEPFDPGNSNFAFISRQPGLFVFLVGTVPESFYSNSLIVPGSTFGGSSEVFVDGGLIKINGVSYDNLGFDVGSLFINSFTFPTNGKDFTVPVQASFSVNAQIFWTGMNIHINGTASGKVTFKYLGGLYAPSRIVLTTVPEPATLGLMGTGLAGIFAFARTKLKRIHHI